MATNVSKKRKQQKAQAITRVLIVAAILVCVNMLAARFHYGLDLTKEKRFTLSDPTKKLLRNMEDVAVIDVYLEGKFPAGFQRLQEATRERLQSFRDVAGGKVVFRFSNPFEGKSEDEKGAVYQQFAEKGIAPINLRMQGEDEGYSEKFVFPYALVRYNGNEMAVRLLENKLGQGPRENLNYSESLLEYKFANAINKLTLPAKTEIAYVMGNGEMLGANTYDLLTTLEKQYKVDTIDLTNSIYISPIYKAIIINNPSVAFDDKAKFKIDQYVMSGGSVLWAVDQLNTPMDSLMRTQQFIALDKGLNLNDMLFKYGVRINPDLIEDIICLPIPITVGMQGDRPQIELRNWIYFPVFNPASSHPIVNNMNFIMGQFVNSIDTVSNPDIKKTILLASSKNSRTAAAPTRVSLSMLKYPVNPRDFRKKNIPTAVLLEGKFTSVFKNRMHPNFLQVLKDSLNREFKEATDSSAKMIVIADGDVMLNDFSSKNGPMEMGYWQFTQQRFANKDFILNCIEYLTDNSGLLAARSKNTRLRLLDPERTKKEETKWRMINIGVPLVFVLIFASVYLFFRKRKYESPITKK
ncbi:MAG: gliding motility-associated ABC transporter substrate-binding protein GldG [Flavipsychrobacter sp.]